MKDMASIAERVEQGLQQTVLWDEVKDRLQDSALGLSGVSSSVSVSHALWQWN